MPSCDHLLTSPPKFDWQEIGEDAREAKERFPVFLPNIKRRARFEAHATSRTNLPGSPLSKTSGQSRAAMVSRSCQDYAVWHKLSSLEDTLAM